MNKKKMLAAGSMAAVSLMMAVPAFAATDSTHVKDVVVGTVSSINGTTLTVNGKKATFTVDAGSATVQKGFGKKAPAMTLASVSVGDTIRAKGTVTGTSVQATAIHDAGVINLNGGTWAEYRHTLHPKATFGKVASVNGSSFTLTEKLVSGDQTITVNTDASTKFKKNGASGSVSDVSSGERVVVRGTKSNDGSISAKSVHVHAK